MPDILLLLTGFLAGAFAAAAALVPKLRQARTTAALLETELSAARRDRGAMEAELQAAHDALDARDREIRIENAELRRRMDELADMIMRQEGAAPPPAASEP
ncbi:hypothetical protein [Enterovirga aerilata]|uniref:Uncharacterized protein n=1 Tax=Enterovirga aerilata TaxID=2730920 RepID=A0A849I7C4_9HYPH|nr:hypothetical protein [Enterovirga sp. DB1703]NNM73654.1 hypothetical protein [Enterovirga sp. DB1703]